MKYGLESALLLRVAAGNTTSSSNPFNARLGGVEDKTVDGLVYLVRLKRGVTLFLVLGSCLAARLREELLEGVTTRADVHDTYRPSHTWRSAHRIREFPKISFVSHKKHL